MLTPPAMKNEISEARLPSADENRAIAAAGLDFRGWLIPQQLPALLVHKIHIVNQDYLRYLPGRNSNPLGQWLTPMRPVPLPVSQETPFDLPGINLPLTFTPKLENRSGPALLPNALDSWDIEYGRASYIFTIRELLIMRLIETITNKPDWDRMAFEPGPIARWRREMLQGTEDVTPKMIDWIINEVQWKAQKYKKTGIIKSFDPGVVKSDIAIPDDLRRALQDAVQRLDDSIPLHEKYYRQDSDDKVVDLVHPSLFPLIYGRTKVLQDQLIGIDNCLNTVGQGWTTTKPRTPFGLGQQAHNFLSYSTRFQWLPCDVMFDSEGECRIASYINNLHPTQHRNLYQVIEKVLTRTIPVWEIVLSKNRVLPYRIPYYAVEYLKDNRQTSSDARVIKLPEPDEFVPPQIHPEHQVGLRTNFAEKGVQVIIKLVNIELTPEKPDYEGGRWQLDGLLNERICATAVYHYDSQNITDSELSFRHRPNIEYVYELDYEPGKHQFLSQVFGFDQTLSGSEDGPITQALGSVSCRPGRLVAFPNSMQHCVSPFSLADRSKVGHRKILVLHLVDPHLRVVSTANVPPQREDWSRERQDLIQGVLETSLPVELHDMIQEDIDSNPITAEEAREYKLEMMAERSSKAEALALQFEMGGFPLLI